MKKSLKILILPLAIVTLGGFAGRADAQVPVAQFETTPLFSEINFVPGNSVSRSITFNNTSANAHPAIVRAISVVNPSQPKLSDAVGLVVKQGSAVLYDDTFTNFFSSPKVVLSQVPAGSSAKIDFIVTFKVSAGDDYQNSTMSFALEAGLDDVAVVDDTTVAIGSQQGVGGGGSGGSIVMGHKSLLLSGEIANVDPTQQDAVIVTWNTNIPATSQVIYGPASGGPYSLNLAQVNFGYPFGTVEDVVKVESHSVRLVGVVPGQLYNYRVVSRASPPTVSNEHTFMLDGGVMLQTNPQDRSITIASRGNGNNQQMSTLGVAGISGASVSGVDGADEEVGTTSASTTSANKGSLAAAAFLAGFQFGNWVYYFVAVLLILAGWVWYRNGARG